MFNDSPYCVLTLDMYATCTLFNSKLRTSESKVPYVLFVELLPDFNSIIFASFSQVQFHLARLKCCV